MTTVLTTVLNEPILEPAAAASASPPHPSRVRSIGARLLRFWALAAVGATLLTLFTAFQTFMQFLLRGDKMVFSGQVRWSAFVWYTWALLAPFAIALIRRYPIERGRGMARAIAFNALLTIGFVGLHAIIAAHLMVAANLFGMAELGYSTQVVSLLASQAHWGLLLYVGLVAMVHVVYYFQRAQVESLAREELRAQAASAQLMALSQQMQPHFLFNALNALVAMQDEGGAAQTFTIRLADMLRMLLHSGGRATASLAEELALVDAYLEIERARLGSRLRTDISIPATLVQCRLPAFTLQPLVENAITHSIARTPEGGEIQVRATLGSEEIAIDVSNTCNPAIAQPAADEGMRLALPNCRRRLLLMYGPAARFDAGFVGRNLFRASIILPADAASRPPVFEDGR